MTSFSWSVGCASVDLLVDLLVYQLIFWLIGWLFMFIGWSLVVLLIGWSVGCGSVVRFSGLLDCRMIVCCSLVVSIGYSFER